MSQQATIGRVVLAAVALVAVGVTPTATAAAPEPAMPLFGEPFSGEGGHAVSIAVGDFTGDRKDDVAASLYLSDNTDSTKQIHKFVVQSIAPDGYMRAAQEFDIQPPGNNPGGIAAGDVDEDGDLDVVMANRAGIDLYKQVAGRLQTPQRMEASDFYRVELGDLDGDGHLDLVVMGARGLLFLPGAGDGTWGPAELVNGPLFTDITVGDVNGDGQADAVGATDRDLYVFSRSPAGGFSVAEYREVIPHFARSEDEVALGDLNGDGRTDVAVLRGGLRVFPQKADGTLGAPVTTDSTIVGGQGSLAAGDMNLDGRTDLVAINFSITAVFAQDASGQLRPPSRSFRFGDMTYGAAVGELSGDGVPDILARSSYAGPVLLKSATGLQAWGLNNWRQVGSWLQQPFAVPWGPLELTDEVSIAGGAAHSLAVTSLGRVWGWGMNDLGQLGIGARPGAFVPTHVIDGMRSVAAGGLHSLAVARDGGTVWTWGWNAFGQLGDGTTTDSARARPVPGLTDVVGIAGGVTHSLAVTASGEVWAWGLNHVGQLGTGSTASSLVPARVPGLSGIVAVSAGHFHSLALGRDGRVWAWGFNDYGQLGTGSDALYITNPQLVPSARRFTAVAAGGRHSIALVNDGTVQAWGLNNVGELGNGSTVNSRVPLPVSSLSSVVGVAAGWYHSLAVKRDGTAWAWGWNHFGQLGLGMTSDVPVVLPLRVTNLRGATAVSAGLAHSLAITAPAS